MSYSYDRRASTGRTAAPEALHRNFSDMMRQMRVLDREAGELRQQAAGFFSVAERVHPEEEIDLVEEHFLKAVAKVVEATNILSLAIHTVDRWDPQ